MNFLMKARQWMIALGLGGLVLLGFVGLYLTRDSGQTSGTAQKSSSRQAPLVDEQPLRTAQAMTKLASTWDEARLAEQALKVADREVDLAFADALRDAAEHPAPATPQSRDLYAREKRAEAEVKSDQSQIDQLTKQLTTAGPQRQDNLQQQLAIIQAQMELDEGELDDAKEDLIRSGADPLSRIQLQFNRHEAALQNNEPSHAQVTPSSSPVNYAATNLVEQITAWQTLHSKVAELEGAQNEAIRDVNALSQTHEALEKQVRAEKADKQAITQVATSQLTSDQTGGAGGASGETTAALLSLHSLAVDQKDLADLDKRIQNQQELRDGYGSWIELVKLRQLAALHGMVRSVLWIVLIVFGAYLAGWMVNRLLPDMGVEHTRFRTLRTIIRFATQAVAVLLVLFVIFGTPNQMPTILGLATAGLTVALKDFVVAFVGWFVLMGRNGIRAGDWVEINGVVGEVLEVSLLRTVLLETGNWTDTGHPTGRKVAFMNGFAIEGHFFNFSTAGQWLWDELQLMVPSDQDPYPIIEAIQKLVTKETEANARMAEQEWQHATSRYRVRAVSATPAVNLRPTASGVEVHIRYSPRAQERYVTRARLYQELVDLLRRRGVEPAESVPAAAAKS
jgi:small-conductance mechanosensitive channel